MKIFAVINNYASKRDIFGPFVTQAPLWYEMPDSSILRSGNPFFIPDFDSSFSVHPSLVYRIGRLGKNIAPRFAERYIDAWGVGCGVVAEGLLQKRKTEGMPWTDAVSFDRSCLLGNLRPIDAFNINKDIEIKCSDRTLTYSSRNLKMPIEEVIALLSRNNTLKNGDLILVGLHPSGLRPEIGSRLVAFEQDINSNLLDINIR